MFLVYVRFQWKFTLCVTRCSGRCFTHSNQTGRLIYLISPDLPVALFSCAAMRCIAPPLVAISFILHNTHDPTYDRDRNPSAQNLDMITDQDKDHDKDHDKDKGTLSLLAYGQDPNQQKYGGSSRTLALTQKPIVINLCVAIGRECLSFPLDDFLFCGVRLSLLIFCQVHN